MRDNMQFYGYIPELTYEVFAVSGAYKFNKKKPLHWLQRLCLWVLNRLGCQYYRTETTCQTLTVNFDDIVELVFAQRHAIEAVSRSRCRYLVLGREQMEALDMAMEIPEHQMMINFPTFYEAPINRQRGMFAGMAVIFVPWFDGIVCLGELR